MNADNSPLSLWPAWASASAFETDKLILAFTLLTLVLTVPVFAGITWFAIKYREGREVDRSHREARNDIIELSWLTIPFLLTLFFFVWGAKLFIRHKTPPKGAITISAIGRQWMWKFQHPGGQAEINDLHVPTGQPILIRMTSQDVIHSLYIPALRIQMETLPDRTTEMWFQADRPGVYHLFCSEYCGTDHSKMDGKFIVMRPTEYQDWLAGAGSPGSLAAAGKPLFASYGCGGCHGPGSSVRAPSLAGLFGRPVPLEAGGTIPADATYIRDKILDPNRNKIAGYKQVMPSYKGVIPEDNLVRLVAYIETLKASEASR